MSARSSDASASDRPNLASITCDIRPGGWFHRSMWRRNRRARVRAAMTMDLEGCSSRIADTFTDSFAKLTGDEQKAVKTAAFDPADEPGASGPGAAPGRPGRRTRTSGPFGSVATSGSSSTGPLPASCSATSIITTRRINGPNDGGWNGIRGRVLRSLSRSARRFARFGCRGMWRWTSPRPPKGAAAVRPAALRTTIFADSSDDDLLDYGVPVEWLKTCGPRRRTRCSTLADHLPGEGRRGTAAACHRRCP